jgi:hypothetical protein
MSVPSSPSARPADLVRPATDVSWRAQLRADLERFLVVLVVAVVLAVLVALF